MQPVQLPTTPRMQPLVPVHRSALAHLMMIRRQPAVHPGIHPCSTTRPPAAFRKAARKSPHCGPQLQNQPTGSRLPPLPPPSTPTHPAPCHAAAPAGRSTSQQTQSPPPAGLPPRQQCALRPAGPQHIIPPFQQPHPPSRQSHPSFRRKPEPPLRGKTAHRPNHPKTNAPRRKPRRRQDPTAAAPPHPYRHTSAPDTATRCQNPSTPHPSPRKSRSLR